MWTRQDMQIIFQGPNHKYIAQSKKIDSRYFPVTVKETDSDVMTWLNIFINARISEAEVQDCHCQLGLREEEFGGFRERGIPQAKFGKTNDWSKGEGGPCQRSDALFYI